MMTPQEVASCTFTKAVMGGYNMASEDDFLDKLTEDYTALYKENAELTGKIQTLASKLEEYREIEDAMRSTLLTAQRMASNMVAEAEKKRDDLVDGALKNAKDRSEEIQRQIEAEEQRLIDYHKEIDEKIALEDTRLIAGQEKLRSFIATVQSVCQDQLAFLEKLPELPAQETPAAPAAEEPALPLSEEQEEAEEVEEDNSDDTAEMEKNIQNVIAAFAKEVTPANERDSSAPKTNVSADSTEDNMDATRVLNLDELQFGRNYTKE